MLRHLRQLPRQCLACQRRAIFTSIFRRQEFSRQNTERYITPAKTRVERIASHVDKGFKTWLREVADVEFKSPLRARNWLQDDTPYPANPSFRPPPPISDALRSEIYDLFMADPIKYNIRELGARYHLSLKRVEAILRLKGLEAHWKKKKLTQTGFLYGMEQLLGVKTKVTEPQGSELHPRFQVEEADAEDQEEGAARDLARQRYQRFFFEPVLEGTEPTMPGILQKAKDDAAAAAAQRREDKSNEEVMPRFPGFLNNPPKVQVVEREGRPTVKFVDIGGKFIDVVERKQRIKAGERRRRIKNQRKEEKYQQESKESLLS